MNNRNSNIELLRIFSMFIIILGHYSFNGLGVYDLPYSVNRYFAAWFFSSADLGVVIFFIISGYYMCTQQFSLRKLLRLYGELWFYSVGFYVVFALMSRGGDGNALAELGMEFGIIPALKAFFSVGFNQKWFATDYIVLMVTSPLLNVLLQHLSKKRLQQSLVIATIFWSVIYVFTNAGYGYARIVYIYVLYMYAGYVRLHVNLKGSPKRNALIAALSQGMVYLAATAIIVVGRITGLTSLYSHASHFSGINSPFVLIAAVELLIVALKMPPFHNQVINTIASTTFGIYLIHANTYVSPYLWKVLIGLPDRSYGHWWMPLHAIAVAVFIFVVCSVMDIVRQKTVDRAWRAFIDYKMANIQRLTNNMLDRACIWMEHIIDILV